MCVQYEINPFMGFRYMLRKRKCRHETYNIIIIPCGGLRCRSRCLSIRLYSIGQIGFFLLLGPPPISKVHSKFFLMASTFDIGGGPRNKKTQNVLGGGGVHGSPIWPMDYKRMDRHLLRHRKPPQGIIIMLHVLKQIQLMR